MAAGGGKCFLSTSFWREDILLLPFHAFQVSGRGRKFVYLRKGLPQQTVHIKHVYVCAFWSQISVLFRWKITRHWILWEKLAITNSRTETYSQAIKAFARFTLFDHTSPPNCAVKSPPFVFLFNTQNTQQKKNNNNNTNKKEKKRNGQWV